MTATMAETTAIDDQADFDFWTKLLEEHPSRQMFNVSRGAFERLLKCARRYEAIRPKVNAVEGEHSSFNFLIDRGEQLDAYADRAIAHVAAPSVL